MPINGHGQNMLSGGNNGLLNVCVNNATNANNSTKTNNGNKNGHRSSHQTHPHLSNVSTSSSPTSFMHESHSNGAMHMNGAPMSPSSQDEFSSSYDLNSHLKRKELFTQRKQREFIPDNKKDDSYWDRRRRNNEAAKRSREKRRYNDMVLEQRVVELTKENHVLKAQLDAIKDKYNICGENLVSVEQIMATLPTTEQVLSITKRPKFNNGPSPCDLYPQSPSSPIQTSVIQQSSSGPASVDSSSPPAPSAAAPPTAPTIVAPIIAQAPPIQPSVVTTAAFAHLNNGYLDVTPPRNAYKYRDNGTIEIDTRHDMYGGPRPNFHNPTEHTNSNNNNTNGCNGNAVPVNARYSQHLSPISRSTNAQADHHRHAAHAIVSHQHLHPLQHFSEANDVNKISQSNSNCAGSDTDITAVDDDSNVLNLSRRRNSDTTNCNNSSNGNHKGKNGNETPPRNIYASLGSSASAEDDQYSVDNQPISDTNNSLPLKLRHKSHLGDKDAATALLALQHIKQEPNSRLSPPWDGEGSSDERDSGISIGTAEWGLQRSYPLNDRSEPSQIPLNIRSMTAKTFTIPSSVGINGIGAAIGNLAANLSSVGVMGGLTMGSVLGVNENSSDRDERSHRFGEPKSFRAPVMCHLEINSNSDEGNVKEENVHLKTQIARLESEVASIKNMMILNTNSASATAVQ